MPRLLRCLAAALAFGLAVPCVADAQRPPPPPFPPRPSPPPRPGKQQNLRAALHELREARQELKASREPWPAGHRERTLQAIDDAMRSVQALLSIKSVDTFTGVDRSPDFYKKNYRDLPHMRAALGDLREARNELTALRPDRTGLKAKAIDDVDIAIGHIVASIRWVKDRR